MALWQYTFIIIPEESIPKESASDKFSEKYYHETNLWENKYKSNSFDKIDKILQKGKSWSKDIILFGEEASNALEVILEKNRIVEVIFRIDFRTDYSSLLKKILEFCHLNGFILLDENLNIIPFNTLSTIKIIENSPQYNKMKDMNPKIRTYR